MGKVKGIKLSEVIKSLEVLQNLCNKNEICGTCWLYDPDEKGTACFLAKEKLESLADNIEAALEYIALEHSCIMPECPYCPSCEHGFVSYPEDTMPGETGINTEWHCTYDPELKESETDANADDMAATGCADQDDRSDS